MELKTMKTSTAKSSFNHLRGLKLAALAIGTSFVLAGCAGNPPTEQYAWLNKPSGTPASQSARPRPPRLNRL